MAKVSRTYRFEPEVIKMLETIVQEENNLMLADDRVLIKKEITATDIIQTLIIREYKRWAGDM